MNQKKKKRTAYMRLHFLLAGLIRFFMRVHVHGRENVPKEGGAIVCANHLSLSDPVTIAAAFPRQLSFLAKAELFNVPVLKHLIRALGARPLDRRGDVSAIKKSTALVKEGQLLLIFPQGTRRKGQNPADTPFKNGAGTIAVHADVPMIPVCIKMKKMRWCFLRRIDIIIGKPIPLTAPECENETASESAARATKCVMQELYTLGGWQETGADAPQGSDKEVP